jgi:hypothetical protein
MHTKVFPPRHNFGRIRAKFLRQIARRSALDLSRCRLGLDNFSHNAVVRFALG